jgi:DNA-binding IclR family transcriptional regulator
VPVARLTIDDYSDREFLLVLADVADADGWATAQDMADRLDLTHKSTASSRLSWLRRWGAVEKEHERDEHGVLRYYQDGKPRYTQRWRLTPEGQQFATGKLRKADEAALERLKDESMGLVTRWLSDRSRGDTTRAKLMQREWRYGHAKGRV